RLRTIQIEANRQKHKVRAKLASLETRHRRTNSEGTRRVIARGHHATPGSATDGDRNVREFRSLTHLDGCVEAVHVEMNDLASHPRRRALDIPTPARFRGILERNFVVVVRLRLAGGGG